MVFTGLVSGVGFAVRDPVTNKVYIKAPRGYFNECNTGDSIAINGCCLTLLSKPTDFGHFFVMEETRSKTNLIEIPECSSVAQIPHCVNTTGLNSPVNLELALKNGDPIGGHYVTGHIDGVAPVLEVKPHGDGSRSIWIDLSGYTQPTVVFKGSIAIDGVSLTVAELAGKKMRVSLVPHTLEKTTLQYLKLGTVVNVEFDHALKHRLSINALDNAHAPRKLETDEDFMLRAIELGERGRTTAAPNPWVGCVMTDSQGNIIGEGYHQKAGEGHAEVNAIHDAIARGHQDKLKGCTCYVTLEPCSHFGRTGPCDQLLIHHGIGRVVVAATDPDTLVNGNGLKNLNDHGIPTSTGVLEEQARQSLRPYLHHRTTGMPWTVLKFGMSLDGKIFLDEMKSPWITGDQAREDSHIRFRATSQAIMVGKRTAVLDNPTLTVRTFPVNCDQSKFTQPLRVVVASKPFPLGSNLSNTTIAPTAVLTTDQAQIQGYPTNVEVITVGKDNNGVDLKSALKELGNRGVLQVLIEGGATLGSGMIQLELVDQLVIYQSPVMLGSDGLSWARFGSKEISSTKSKWTLASTSVHGPDVCTEYVKKSLSK